MTKGCYGEEMGSGLDVNAGLAVEMHFMIQPAHHIVISLAISMSE